MVYFNPPAPCGAGPHCPGGRIDNQKISIHPPRAGRDKSVCNHRPCTTDFNPPAPCGAGQHGLHTITVGNHFNPPAPCGAGRHGATDRISGKAYFNPPAPCGAGLVLTCRRLILIGFQSTRPVRGGTVAVEMHSTAPRFQSTRPVRGGTSRRQGLQTHVSIISIHPPRAGRDQVRWVKDNKRKHFNPPAPCGAGPIAPTAGRR